MSGTPRGYAYSNPDHWSGNFEVVRTGGITPVPRAQARAYQGIIKESLAAQLQHLTAPEDVRQTADPDNEDMVEGQQRRIAEAGGLWTPEYYQANFPVPRSAGRATFWYMAAVAKAKFADGRSEDRRSQSPDPEARANLADVGDVYVLPGLQRRGYGSALLRSMLDRYPEDMAAVVYEYPRLNPAVTPLLTALGFSEAQSRQAPFSGTVTDQVMYAGPACGDVIEALEARYPWLTEREPIADTGAEQG